MDQSCINSYDIDCMDPTGQIECQCMNKYVLICHCIHFDNWHHLPIIMEQQHESTIAFCNEMNDGDLGTVESKFKSLIGHHFNYIDHVTVKIEFVVKNSGDLNQINAISMNTDIWNRTLHDLEEIDRIRKRNDMHAIFDGMAFIINIWIKISSLTSYLDVSTIIFYKTCSNEHKVSEFECEHDHDNDSNISMIITILYKIVPALTGCEVQFFCVFYMVVQVIDKSLLILIVLIEFGVYMRIFISFTCNLLDYSHKLAIVIDKSIAIIHFVGISIDTISNIADKIDVMIVEIDICGTVHDKFDAIEQATVENEFLIIIMISNDNFLTRQPFAML